MRQYPFISVVNAIHPPKDEGISFTCPYRHSPTTRAALKQFYAFLKQGAEHRHFNQLFRLG